MNIIDADEWLADHPKLTIFVLLVLVILSALTLDRFG